MGPGWSFDTVHDDIPKGICGTGLVEMIAELVRHGLVNRDGEVVGIVTAIYNPTGQRVFAGMAFAVPIENAAKAVGNNPL